MLFLTFYRDYDRLFVSSNWSKLLNYRRRRCFLGQIFVLLLFCHFPCYFFVTFRDKESSSHVDVPWGCLEGSLVVITGDEAFSE